MKAKKTESVPPKKKTPPPPPLTRPLLAVLYSYMARIESEAAEGKSDALQEQKIMKRCIDKVRSLAEKAEDNLVNARKARRQRENFKKARTLIEQCLNEANEGNDSSVTKKLGRLESDPATRSSLARLIEIPMTDDAILLRRIRAGVRNAKKNTTERGIVKMAPYIIESLEGTSVGTIKNRLNPNSNGTTPAGRFLNPHSYMATFFKRVLDIDHWTLQHLAETSTPDAPEPDSLPFEPLDHVTPSTPGNSDPNLPES